jgi:hypothetical protein
MNNLIPPVNAVYVLLGVVFVIGALSLLVSIVMEMLALILNSRAETLLSAIWELFQGDKTLFEQFTRHPHFRQIVGGTKGLTGTPNYLPAASFADICLEILQLSSQVETGKSGVQSEVPELDTFLKDKFEKCNREATTFQAFLERWYNGKMDFAWERYQREVKYRLFFISLFIAVLFNADIIGLFARISDSLRSTPVAVMTATTDNLTKLVALDSTLRYSDTVKNIELKLLTQMEAALAPSEGNILGWTAEQITANGFADWLVRITGYLVSALLLSYGAQLWFAWIKKKF